MKEITSLFKKRHLNESKDKKKARSREGKIILET